MQGRNNKAGWREIGGKRKYYRSAWEANYARWLEYQKINGHIVDWMHEPKTFWFEGIKRGQVSYKPDFWVLTNNEDSPHYWVEVKGWMDPKSATKIKRFHKYFPKERLTIIDSKWFKRFNAKMRLIIKDWEADHGKKKLQIKRKSSYCNEGV